MSENKKLNKAQKEAVGYTDGPLLIVAGAGTGKTTVISSKICYLLENNLAKPEEILALTFTDKAAEEMQTRVDAMLDLGYTELHISTFHAWCQKVLERHALDIGLSNQFKLLTGTGAWLLVRKNFQLFNLDYYRPMGNPYRHIHELVKHFSKCKDELISPEDYLTYAEEMSKSNGEMVIEEKNRLNEIANAYHVYNQLLRDNAAMDFGDLIYFTHQLFEKRPQILQQYQKQFKYILVDEVQDVNWSQYSLLQQLQNKGSQLTVVGDDDQSIYAFRGASVSNILRFKDDFPEAKEIVLNENYRSAQSILDTAYRSVQNNNPDRLEIKLKIDKKLVSKITTDKEKKHSENVVHLHLPTLDDEVEAVVNEIARLKKTDQDSTWDDFAILVRANGHADPFLNRLERAGLPYEFLASAGLFRQPIILDCLSFFRALDNVREDTAVYRLLLIPFLNFKENDLQKITFFAKKKSAPYYEALKRGREFDLGKEGLELAEKLIALIHAGLQQIRSEKPSTVLYDFLEKSGYLQHLTKGEEAGDREIIRQIYHLKQFFDFLKEFETINENARLNSFLDHFNQISEAGDRGSLSQVSDTPDSINILTVHAAKGLEFKYVFVVNLVEDRFPSRNRGGGIEIPSELVKEQLPSGDGHIEEERRLFYVAMTRAKERLYFTSASDYGGERTKKISRFLNELDFKVTDIKKSDKKIVAAGKNASTAKGQFIYELPKVFSFSQVKAYETCPYQYKLAHILKIPTKGSASFSFGQTIHGTMQAFYGKIQELNAAEQISLFSPTRTTTATEVKTKVPTLTELYDLYDKNWLPDWYKTELQRQEYYQKGKDLLKIFYEAEDGHWTIPERLESWFKIKVGEYFMHGRIDRVDKLPDGTIEIIDYKTGKSKEKLSTDDKDQLFIYQIAAQQVPEYRNLGPVGRLTYFYVNDNLRSSFVGEDKDLEKISNKLVATIDKINSKNFTATPSQFACDYCDFKEICEHRL